jgi:hypothetical protein
MPNDKKNFKLIAVKNREYTRLSSIGHTPMSFNDVLIKILDFWEQNKNDNNNNIADGNKGQEEEQQQEMEITN